MTTHDSNVKIVRATTSGLEISRTAVLTVMAPSTERKARFSESALALFLQNPANFLLLALSGGDPVGCLYGYALPHPTRPEPQFFLYAIDVVGDYSNRGIGTALVNEFIATARNAGAWEVWVITSESNRAAFAMYTRAGMKRCAEDDVVLMIDLKKAPEGDARG